MKEIGGYFELELDEREELHPDAIKLNSGRSALEYILKAQVIGKFYLPAFICDSVLEPLKRLGIDFVFYNINEKLELTAEITLRPYDKLLYVNYFAMKSQYIKFLAEKYSDQLIVDNTQALFERPLAKVDTFYSPRKFVGVSDGGYLYTDTFLGQTLETDSSYRHAAQLMGRIDKNASDFYTLFQEAERRLIAMPLKKMSAFTSKVLRSIDYERIRLKRERNFWYLHHCLQKYNGLKMEEDLSTVPFVYPFLHDDKKIRERLLENKVYVARYWNEVLTRVEATQREKDLVHSVIPLPIDQRYELEDMQRIVEIIVGSLHVQE